MKNVKNTENELNSLEMNTIIGGARKLRKKSGDVRKLHKKHNNDGSVQCSCCIIDWIRDWWESE